VKVGVIQSCYVPWRGYFDLIRSVDLFVVYDDVQYSKGGWRNRNQLKLPAGLRWMTVPVRVSLGQRIDEVEISNDRKSWVEEHIRLLRDALSTAPYFSDAWEIWSMATRQNYQRLSQLNVHLLKSVCEYLGIRTPLVMSSDYPTHGESTARLLSLLRAVGATSYLSGPSAATYLDKGMFAADGIRLEYKSYDYAPYPQLHGNFVGAVTILDLIANCGRESSGHIVSTTPDRPVEL
jgi:hypothetical protein